MEAWQSPPLDPIWPVSFVDGIQIKFRDGSVTSRVVYVVMGINLEGERDTVGLQIGPPEANPLSRVDRKTEEPSQPDRPDQRLEVHLEQPDHPLTRPHHSSHQLDMTTAATHTKQRY